MKEKMTPYLSDKLKVMSLICILLVVWIHTYYMEGTDYTRSVFLMNVWGCGVCLWAVPMFYCISGYLFFMEADEIKFIFQKQKKRFRTLLIPYVLTNILSILFYCCIKIVGRHVPSVATSMNFNLLDRGGDTICGHLYYWFWEGPIAFQMWFVRDLMVIVALAPSFYYLLRLVASNKWLAMLALLGCVALIDLHYTPQFWAFAWFAIGGIFAMCKALSVIETKKWSLMGVLLLLISVGVIIVDAAFSAKLIDRNIDMDYITITGVPGLWITYDTVVKGRLLSKKKLIAPACSCTFFIYLIHEPFLNIFKKLPLMVSQNEVIICVCYIVVPLLFATTAIFAACMFKNYIPKAYGIFTGGRV